MARVDRYFDPSAAGANDGTSETDAWETWGDAATGINAMFGTDADQYIALWCKRQSSRYNPGANINWTLTNTPGTSGLLKIEGYETTEGDGGLFWFDQYGFQVAGYYRTIIANFDGTTSTAGQTFNLVRCFVRNIIGQSSYVHGASINLTDCTSENVFALHDTISAVTTAAVAISRGSLSKSFIYSNATGLNVNTAYRAGVVSDVQILASPSPIANAPGINIQGANASGYIVKDNSVQGFPRGIQFESGVASPAGYLDVFDNVIGGSEVGIYVDTPSNITYPVWRNYIQASTSLTNLTGDNDYFSDQQVELTTNPFVDGPGGDFGLNDTVGGGAVVKAGGSGVNLSTLALFSEITSDPNHLAGAVSDIAGSTTYRGGYTPEMPLHNADKLELLLRSAGQWIDSSTDQMATFFVAHKTRTIPKIGVICNAITGTSPTYRVEIQTHVNRTPTGTLVAAGASGTFTPTGTGNYEITIDTPPSLTVGDEYCVVIKHDSGTVDASNRAQFLLRDFSAYEANPSGAETANDWSTQTNRTAKPMFGPIFADGLSEGSTLFGLGSTPGHTSEKGMKFVVPADATMIVRGARGGGRCFQDDIKLTLYDSDGTTVLATETFTVNNMVSSGERLTVTMALPETTLTAGTYYLAVSPAGATSNQIQSHEIDMFNTPMARQFYGEGCAAVERATPGSGAWTENASRVQSLSINGEYVGPAAGGGTTLIVVDD